jgi:hypothetical protein
MKFKTVLRMFSFFVLALFLCNFFAIAQIDKAASTIETQMSGVSNSAKNIGKYLCISAVVIGLGVTMWKTIVEKQRALQDFGLWLIIACLGAIGWGLIGSSILFN